ncbi:MAG: RtcB family protein [Bacillota bacterium]
MDNLLTQIDTNKYLIPKENNMNVHCIIYLKPELLPFLEDESIKQLKDAACLPGVFKYVLGMPDIHTGYGLPIGGVLPMDYDHGVVSAGAVGMDINCGVRILTTNLTKKDLAPNRLEKLINAIEETIPTGIGTRSRHKLNNHLKNIIEQGAPYLAQLGLVNQDDLGRIEEHGFLPGADLAACSKEARNRTDQLSTLGGGNHFIEISLVNQVFDPQTAAYFKLFKGQVVVMIHSGSRGFGHQICQDYTKEMASSAAEYGIKLPNKGLACAPIHSPLGQRYLAAMACAVNFAFANRQLMSLDISHSFNKVFGTKEGTIELNLLYDVAHNIAKKERHFQQNLLIHRKGATRALPPGHPANPEYYMATGHPVLLPGSMGANSYIATGLPGALETFYSVNHGAGRLLSRTAAKKTISKKAFEKEMEGIYFNARHYHKVLDEAPQAYKDIHQVVDTLAEIGIVNKVASIRPLGVIKGEG